MSAKPPACVKRTLRKGKVLRPDMISSPLGDFRHTIHIGSRGADDVFGDLSFLRGKLHLLPAPHRGNANVSAAALVRSSSLQGAKQRGVPSSSSMARTSSLQGATQLEDPSPALARTSSLQGALRLEDPSPAQRPASGLQGAFRLEDPALKSATSMPAMGPKKPPRLHLEPGVGPNPVPEPGPGLGSSSNIGPNSGSSSNIGPNIGPSSNIGPNSGSSSNIGTDIDSSSHIGSNTGSSSHIGPSSNIGPNPPIPVSGPCPAPGLASSPVPRPGPAEAFLPHAVSMLSLQLDLGPSILDDILLVMEGTGPAPGRRRPGGVRDGPLSDP